MDHYDVIVIGTGTGGQTAAFGLAEADCRVAVVERGTPGGVCALYGCQAKKYYYEVAEVAARCRHLSGLGITADPGVDWGQITAAKNRFTESIPAGTRDGLRGGGIDYHEGEASFRDQHTIRVGDRDIGADFIVVATGARPMELPIAGSEHLLDSTGFLDLSRLPERIAFVGGGFISFEFAHFAARLGARPGEIHILEAMERPLGPFDADMVEALVQASAADGIRVHTGVAVAEIHKEQDGFRVEFESGPSVAVDLVVHGAGRTPNIDMLDLDAAGIDHTRQGITVDPTMLTSVDTIYAVGDCADSVQLARVADREAQAAVAHILARREGGEPAPIDYGPVPAVLFTYPQLGMVGKTEGQLQEAGVRYWKSSDTNVGWPTYRRVGMKHAAYKVLVGADDRLLGAHVLSDNATGLINTFKQAMIDRVEVRRLRDDNIMSPYPSRESDIIYMLNPLVE